MSNHYVEALHLSSHMCISSNVTGEKNMQYIVQIQLNKTYQLTSMLLTVQRGYLDYRVAHGSEHDHADSRHANPTHGWQNRGSHRYERRLYMKQYNGVLKHQETQAHIFLYLVNKVKLHYKMVPHRKIPTQQFGGKR